MYMRMKAITIIEQSRAEQRVPEEKKGSVAEIWFQTFFVLQGEA